MPYDSFKDFVPVTQLAAVPLVLVVPATSPIKSVSDLVAKARASDAGLNFGSAGSASAQHLSGELFKPGQAQDAACALQGQSPH